MFTLPPDLPSLFRSPIPAEFLLGGLGFFVPGCFCCGGGGAGTCSKAYAWGGVSRPSTHLSDNDEYDPDTWTSKTDMPSPTRYRGYGGHAGGKAYSCFGYSSTAPVLDTDEYDPDTWTTKTDGPTPSRSGGGSASLGDAIYCFYGADSSSNQLKDTDEYIPDTWTTKTDGVAPTRLFNSGSSTANFAYSTGGNNLGANLRDHEQYAVESDSWASMTDMPTPARCFAGAVALDSDVCLMAGEDLGLGTFKRDSDSYNEISGAWTSRTDCPTPARARLGAEAADSAAYIFCGLTSGGTDLQDTDEFVIDVWTSKTDAPTPARDELYSACL